MKQRRRTNILQLFWAGLLSGLFSTLALASEPVAELETNAAKLLLQWEAAAVRMSAEYFSSAADIRLASKEYSRGIENLLEAARAAAMLGEKSEARSSYQKAYDLANDHLQYEAAIRSASELALLYLNEGDFEKAKRLLDEASILHEKSGSQASHPSILFSTAEYLYYRRDISGSVAALRNAIEIVARTDNAREQVRFRLSLAYSYLADDNRVGALEAVEEALAISRQRGDRRGQAFSHIALAFLSANYSTNQEALREYKLAEGLFPEDLDRLEKASMYNGIGRIYQDFGNWERSLDYRKKALDLFQKANDKLGIAATLPSIAVMQSRIYPENVDLVRASFETAYNQAASIGDNYQSSIVLDELGSYYFSIKDFKNARLNYLAALKFYETVKVKRRIASVKARLALIHLDEGEYSIAGKRLDEASKLNEEISNRFFEPELLYNRARLNLLEGNPAESLTNIKRSIDLTENLYGDLPRSGLQTSYLSEVYDRYEFLTSLLMLDFKSGGSSGEAIRALQTEERGRARSMLDTLRFSDANVFKDAAPERVQLERDIRNQLNTQQDRLVDVLSSGDKNGEAKVIETSLRDLEHRLDEIRAELKQSSSVYSMLKNPEPFDVAEFQADVLDADSVLLEYSLGKDESYLWAVSKTEVNAYYLPSREKIEGRVERLRGLLAQTGIKEGETVEDYQNRIAVAEAEYKVEARALSEELLGQAADKIAGKRLIVVADGKLLYFPIGSLPMPGTETDQPILLTNEVVYEPSASALKILKSERTGAKPAKDLLVFADPVFSKTDERLTGVERDETGLATTLLSVFRSGGALEKLPRLPASEEEANSIRDVVGSGQTTVRSGFAANRDGVVNSDIENYKVLHFATHGLIDEKRPELSGILLSLYDETGKAHDGGVIRLQDVYGLNLRSDLVVLSACETGIGKEVKGEGLMSLNNAFLQAGAKTVVSSLWKVDDTATKQLMTTFYQGITNDGMTASAALRQAQIAMYKDPRYSSPFHWAAFTVQGDYQRVPQLGSIFSPWMFGLLILPVLMFAAYRYRRMHRTG